MIVRGSQPFHGCAHTPSWNGAWPDPRLAAATGQRARGSNQEDELAPGTLPNTHRNLLNQMDFFNEGFVSYPQSYPHA